MDDEDYTFDPASTKVDEGVILEVRRSCHDGDRHYTDPVVMEQSCHGTSYVDTRIES